MAKVYATPGVYIEEKSTFPNSAVPIATAVPAFIGYTEKAIRNKRDLTNTPTRISSFGEYLLYFGGAPHTTYDLEVEGLDYELTPKARHFLLFNSIRLFFANGGNDCYIVSIGDYGSPIKLNDFIGEKIVNKEVKLVGVTTLIKESEPTMVVVPDAVLLAEADYYNLAQQVIAHCGSTMRNRIAILDVYEGYKDRTSGEVDVIEAFRTGVGEHFLDFAAAYYPWLHATIVSTGEVDFLNIDWTSRDRFLQFLKTANAHDFKEGVLQQEEAAHINAEIDKIPLAALHHQLHDFTISVHMLPREVADLEQSDVQAAAAALANAKPETDNHFEEIQQVLRKTRFGRLLRYLPIDSLRAVAALEAYDPVIELVDSRFVRDTEGEARQAAAERLEEMAALMSKGGLQETSQQLRAIARQVVLSKSAPIRILGKQTSIKQQSHISTAGQLKMPQKMGALQEVGLAGVRAEIMRIQAVFANDSVLEDARQVLEVLNFSGDDLMSARSKIEALQLDVFAQTLKDKDQAITESQQLVRTVHESLRTISASYKDIMKSIRRELNLLPPSGAMAGIYTMVDSSIGVWQSPANVSVGSVIKPAVNLTNQEQENLNVPLSGKAINAIRTFPGKGVLVWGARTLDGNSQDWRYISVRRTVIFIEQSIKYTAEAYVFEPNVASTWTNLKALITNFLTNIWYQGALAGATAEDAFSVDVGLGTTMTPVDILDGIMRITVKIAVTRPAEFIVLTFQQQMQKS